MTFKKKKKYEVLLNSQIKGMKQKSCICHNANLGREFIKLNNLKDVTHEIHARIYTSQITRTYKGRGMATQGQSGGII